MRIITDSTCDMTLDVTEKMGVSVAPLKVNFGMTEYVDKYQLSSSDFYKLLEASPTIPTTTLVSAGEFEEEFAKYEEDIVGIFISSQISGTFQAAQIAKDALGRDNIYLVDSGSAALGLGLLVYKAVELRDKGMCAKEIYDALNEIKESLVIYGIVDTLEYLVKGGRLSKTQGFIGGLLSIKPLISVVRGTISSVGKARGIPKSVATLVSNVENEFGINTKERMAFAYSKNPALLETIKKPFENYENYSTHVSSELGSVIGTHAGPNAMAIAFFRK